MGATSTFRGRLVAPTAGAVIASQQIGAGGGAATLPGNYKISVYCMYILGTPADTVDNDNFELVIDEVAVGQCSVGLALNTQYRTDFTANVTQSVKVRAKIAGTAGVAYDAVVALTKDG